MKYFLQTLLSLGMLTLLSAEKGKPDIEEYTPSKSASNAMEMDSRITITVVGQGVAPLFATSPAQAYALAKRAATADAYRIIAERVKGVRIDGKDTIKNMAIKSSYVNTKVDAMIRNAKIIETTFQNGMCEVEMEIVIDKNNFR
jgi:hypothetical protein